MGQEAGALDERADGAEHVGAAVHRLAVHEDPARVGPDQADQHPDHRGLAGAVGAEQPDDLAGLGPERDTVDRLGTRPGRS